MTSLTAPVTMPFTNPGEAQAEARELLSVLPGSPRNLRTVGYDDFVTLSVTDQDRLIELIELSGPYYSDRYLRCSIDLLVTIAHKRNDSTLFDRYAPVLMPVANTQRKHLGGVYKRIRAILGTQENDAAVAIDAYFRQALEEHGFKLGTLVNHVEGTTALAVIDGRYHYTPFRTPNSREHKSLRVGDEVVFNVRAVTARNTAGKRYYSVTMTNLTQH